MNSPQRVNAPQGQGSTQFEFPGDGIQLIACATPVTDPQGQNTPVGCFVNNPKIKTPPFRTAGVGGIALENTFR